MDMLRLILWLFGWGVFIVAVIVVTGGYFMTIAPYDGKDFDKKEWATAFEAETQFEQLERQQACIRGKMARDLLDNLLLTGTHKNDVMAMLGKSDTLSYQGYNNCLRYLLGQCTGLTTDYIMICFNDENLLARAGLVKVER